VAKLGQGGMAGQGTDNKRRGESTMVLTETHFTDELREIAEDHGGILVPAEVVAWAATHPDSALYRQFQWSDEIAGAEHRLAQARHIVRRVTVRTEHKPNQRIRAYVSLRTDRDTPGGGYRILANVLEDPDQRAVLLTQALAEFRLWRRKYDQLKELAGIFEAADKV
jgi:hypothetical protein